MKNIQMHRSQLRAWFSPALLIAGLFAFTIPALCAAPKAAARAPRAYVNDNAGVMDAAAAAQLNGVLAGLDAKAHAQVAVLTVRTLDGEALETYAAQTYKKWGIGDKKTNRGLLLLVAVDDHKARIEVGYGLEGILNDGLTGEIQDRYMVPYFKKGDYSTGVTQGALAIANVIAKDSGVEIGAGPAAEPDGQPAMQELNPFQKVVAVLFIVFMVIFFIRHPFLFLLLMNSGGSRGYGGFGGGGFGGFGGGMSGGGGSSRSW